jgi:hypothetical protein
MDLALKRKELVNWLQEVEDFKLLQQIENIKNQQYKESYKQLLSLEEAKQASISKIDQWPEK